MTKYLPIIQCRLCRSKQIHNVIEFGDVPLANSYPTTLGAYEDTFPLTLMKCDECGHVQLKETVNPQILFDNYLYASSDSPSLVTHFKEYASDVLEMVALEKPKMLEIGSNDGILLKELVKLSDGLLIGVEPAKNIAEVSQKLPELQDAKIFNNFFNAGLASSIKAQYGHMNLICANNVFAHVAELDSVIEGIVELLDPENGVFVFENAYLLDTIKGLYFDQAYHEHLQYYGIRPLVTFLKKHGLEIFHIKRVNTQGGSFRIFAQKQSANKSIRPTVQEFIKAEDDYKLYENDTYHNFVFNLVELKKQLQTLVSEIRSKGKTISCYGCPAKFALFSKFFELDNKTIQYVVDDSPLKQGRYTPGKQIPIVSRQHFLEHPTDYCLVAVWNMADAVIKRNPEFKGTWIKPMPKLEVV